MSEQTVEIDTNRKIDGTVTHNRKMCEKCIYGMVYRDTNNKYIQEAKSYCNYATVAGETALKKVGNKVVNLRGTDPDNCNLFEKSKGKRSSERKKQIRKELY